MRLMLAAGRAVAVLLQFQPGLMMDAVLGSRVVPTLADRTLHRHNDTCLFCCHISLSVHGRRCAPALFREGQGAMCSLTLEFITLSVPEKVHLHRQQ